jgi:hypothetical protein
MSRPKQEPKPEQSSKFIEAAKELGCSEDESGFDEIVKKVAKAPPPRQRHVVHASDCAVNDAPAQEPGACTCGASKAEQ